MQVGSEVRPAGHRGSVRDHLGSGGVEGGLWNAEKRKGREERVKKIYNDRNVHGMRFT